MKKDVVFTVILAILLIVSVVQAVQLNGLRDNIQSGSLELSSPSGNSQSASASGSGQASAPSLPSNLQNLPSMVGGC